MPSATAMPNPEAKPASVPCASVRRKHSTHIGPTVAASTKPNARPLRKSSGIGAILAAYNPPSDKEGFHAFDSLDGRSVQRAAVADFGRRARRVEGGNQRRSARSRAEFLQAYQRRQGPGAEGRRDAGIPERDQGGHRHRRRV